MDLRYTFNEDTANYDRWRPTYVPELFEDILSYAGLGAGSRAVEVGIGTGQATRPFLDAGLSVTAVELGRDLAAFSVNKFQSYPDFSVVNTSFEDFPGAPEQTDLLYSATAFHWIPSEVGYPKAYELLRPGGTLAVFWNRPAPGDPEAPLFADLQQVYRKFEFSTKPTHYDDALHRRIQGAIASAGFIDPQYRAYHTERTFDAESYLCLLLTYSDHRNLPPEIKAHFMDEIKAAILRHGNELTLRDRIDLYLTKKPE